jgi:processive 1,2-diacylglycerol beta-glucosyltransferase
MKRVLILTASIGAGHNQAAKAVAAGLAEAAPHVRVETIDILNYTGRIFRAWYAGGFAIAVTKLPSLYGLGFWLQDRPDYAARNLRERLRLWNERTEMRPLQRRLTGDPPDLIVNTHFLAAPMIAHLAAAGRLAVPQALVVTDICMHRFWYSEGVEQWFAPAEDTAQRLRRWGIDPARILVSGMPIHPKWTATLDRGRILAEWNLPPERPIVLLSGGTEFVCGPVARFAQDILAACPRAYVVVLAGRNKELLGALSALPQAGRDLMPVAFTDRVHELMHVAAVMVTKPGGLSTAECLARGTPMVLLPAVPGQESGNGRYFAAHGAAAMARKVRDVPGLVAGVLNDPAARERMSAAARGLFRPGTATIAEWIRRKLGG